MQQAVNLEEQRRGGGSGGRGRPAAAGAPGQIRVS